MQTFSLKDFEFKLPPEVWDAAQDLCAAGAVRRLTEVEPKFWVAEVSTADYHVEVEVLLAASRVKGFTCECRPRGSRPRACSHVAAVLATLRQFYEKERREREKPAIKPEKEPKRLTVGHILEQAEPEKLHAFLKEWAQQDPDFGLALKARFAAGMPGGTAFFGHLLDAVVQPCRAAKPRNSDFRRLMATLGDLEKQQAAAFEAGSFPTVFQIGGTVVERLSGLAPSLQPPRSQHVEKMLSASLRRLSAVGLRGLVAPGLQSEIDDFFIEILKKESVLPAIEKEVIDFFAEKAARPGQFAVAEKLILEKADGSLFHLKLAAVCFPKLGKTGFLMKLAEPRRPFWETQLLLHLLADRADWATAKELCAFYLQNWSLSEKETAVLAALLFEIARQTGDHAAEREHLRMQFLSTGNFSFFEKLKTASADGWQPILESILIELRRQPQTAATRYRIARILAVEEQTPVLSAYLEAEGDPELLAQFVDYFLKNAPALFFRLVKRLLADHLREHFGRQPAEKAREFLSGLSKKSPKAAAEIAGELLEEFWERQSLVEELGIFLSKAERQLLFDRVAARVKMLDEESRNAPFTIYQ